MKKTAKSGSQNKRRRKKSAQSPRQAGHPVQESGHNDKPQAPRPAAARIRNRQHDENENKRRMWERKQAELEARWVASQARQNIEETARRRNARILRGATGIALAILLGALALHYGQDLH